MDYNIRLTILCYRYPSGAICFEWYLMDITGRPLLWGGMYDLIASRNQAYEQARLRGWYIEGPTQVMNGNPEVPVGGD